MIRRVAADPLEALVIDRLRRLTGRIELDWAEAKPLVRRVQLRADAVEILISRDALAAVRDSFDLPELGCGDRLGDGDRVDVDGADIRIRVAVRPMFRGGRASLTAPVGKSWTRPRPNPALIRALRTTHESLKVLSASPLEPLDRMADATAPAESYTRKTLPLGFLAPDLQRAILQGRQPAGFTLQRMLEEGVPLCWEDQRKQFGFPTSPP